MARGLTPLLVAPLYIPEDCVRQSFNHVRVRSLFHYPYRMAARIPHLSVKKVSLHQLKPQTFLLIQIQCSNSGLLTSAAPTHISPHMLIPN